MEIKRKFELLTVTNRRCIIHQSASDRQMPCAECGKLMLTTEQAANTFGIKQRRIFQIIEKSSVHFVESKTGLVMICPTSLAEVLDGGQTQTPAENGRRSETAGR